MKFGNKMPFILIIEIGHLIAKKKWEMKMNFSKKISKPPPILSLFFTLVFFFLIQLFPPKKHAGFKSVLKLAQSCKKKKKKVLEPK
jgi:hypothetical protein